MSQPNKYIEQTHRMSIRAHVRPSISNLLKSPGPHVSEEGIDVRIGTGAGAGGIRILRLGRHLGLGGSIL